MANNSPTILIVDDEEDVVEIYALALSDAYDVRKAYSGEEALEKVEDTVDVVLLDRRMPGLSGQDVLEKIRQRGIDVRVGMVTAVDPDFDIAEMDFDAYLTKPVADEDIREKVEELLSLSAYDDHTKALFSVAEKKAALEAEKTQQELADSDEYETLKKRASELEAHAAETMDDMDTAAYERVWSSVPEDKAADN
jgi:CheY-like chemotaxis protein